MAVGFPQDKITIDGAAGQLTTQLIGLLSRISSFNSFLQSKQHTDLTALGYTDAEATELQTNFGILAQLQNVFNGTQAIPSAVNISTFALPFAGTLSNS